MNLRKLTHSLCGLVCLIWARRHVEKKSCDILFLHLWDGEIQRVSNLSKSLCKTGLLVKHVVMDGFYKVLLKRLLYSFKSTENWEEWYPDLYVSYLIEKYNPKIVVTLDSGKYAKYLKQHMELSGGYTLNLAHGVLVNSPLFVNYLYHYYFIFGQSSLDAAKMQINRMGNPKISLTGSYLIDRDFILPPNIHGKKVVFFSTWLPAEHKELLLRNYSIIAQWAQNQSKFQLVIKHHPRENPEIIRQIFNGIDNVEFASHDTDMKEILEDAVMAIVCWSCASFEAAMLNRPVIVVNDSDEMTDIIELEKYFLPRARTSSELQQRIEQTMDNYDDMLIRAKGFVKRHMEYTTDSIDVITNRICSIYNDKDDFDYIKLND